MTHTTWIRNLLLLLLCLLVVASDSPSQAASLSPHAIATDFALFAERDITLESYSTVLGDTYTASNLNVEFAFGIQRPERNQGDFFAQGDVMVTGGLHDFDGSLSANGSISFETDFGVDVTGDATYGNSISTNASSIVAGAITQTLDTVPTIGLPPVRTFSVGPENYSELPGEDVVVLAPGAYRNVSLTSQTDELHLSSGDYYMRRLDTWISTELHLDLTNGPINVYVENDVFLESGLTIFVNGEEVSHTSVTPPVNVGLASDVTFEVHGDFTIDDGFLSSFFGTVYTPFGDILVDTQGFYGSMISGRGIRGDFYIEHMPSNRLAGPAVPEPATYAMAMLGLMGLGAISWRRKRAV